MAVVNSPKCPNCNHVIDKVYMVSRCTQVARFDKQGKVLSYGSPIVEDLLFVECPKCGQSSGLDVDNDKLKIDGMFYAELKEEQVC